MVNNKHLLHYVPLGINTNAFRPLEENHENVIKINNQLFGDRKFNFIIGYVSKNARRKHPDNLILGFKHFCDTLTPEQAKKCALILHTDPVSPSGTDLIAVARSLCKNYTVIINSNKWLPQDMCALYNVFDVYANCSSNEGFGLGVTEAMSCGTPVIATVTGGLQDHLGFVDDDGKPIEFNRKFSTNSNKVYTKHGSWAYPLYPQSRMLQGSPETPYIMDCMVDFTQISEGLTFWYKKSKEDRKKCGLDGRNWLMKDGCLSAQYMCD